MEGCAVVNDDRDKFKIVDTDEPSSLLSDLNRSVHCLTSSGNLMCHQNPSSME